MFVILLMISIPALFAINTLYNEVRFIYSKVSEVHILVNQALKADADNCQGNRVCEILKSVTNENPEITARLWESLGEATATITKGVQELILDVPAVFIGIFTSLFITYYLVKDGGQLVNYAKSILPIKPDDQNKLIKRFSEVTYAVVYGNVIVALLQGMLTSVGFFVFGVPSPFVWGIITVFTSLIPFLGTYVIWLPASVFLMIEAYNAGDGIGFLLGIGLLLYGFLIISSIDNILKPKIIGGRANLHPVLVLLGVIGGLSVFGLIGIIVGPVIIAMTTTTIQMMAHQKDKNNVVTVQ